MKFTAPMSLEVARERLRTRASTPGAFAWTLVDLSPNIADTIDFTMKRRVNGNLPTPYLWVMSGRLSFATIQTTEVEAKLRPGFAFYFLIAFAVIWIFLATWSRSFLSLFIPLLSIGWIAVLLYEAVVLYRIIKCLKT